MTADSLVVVSIPHLPTFSIPTATLWDLLSSALSGCIIALVVYFLARRQFRSERWHERQVEAYSDIVRTFEIVKEAMVNRALDEETDEAHGYRPFIPPELEAFEKVAREGNEELRRHLQLKRFFLSRRAVGVLEGYFKCMADPDMGDTHVPYMCWRYCVVPAYRDFYELARVDLGRGWVTWWHVRRRVWRMWEWLKLRRYHVRDWWQMRDYRRERARNGLK